MSKVSGAPARRRRVLALWACLAPPYVLVGHSLGGLNMQLFARRHPQETFALVLVTGIARDELRLLPDRSPAADDANAKRRDIARLYPGSRQLWVDSGHAVPLEKPDAIVAVVREALASRRTSSEAAR